MLNSIRNVSLCAQHTAKEYKNTQNSKLISALVEEWNDKVIYI